MVMPAPLSSPSYLLNNKELACDALAIIEQIQIQLELQLKVDIKTLDNTDSFRLHSDRDDAASDEWLSFSESLFSCLTQKHYSDVRKELINMPSVNKAIPNIDKKFRTKYYLIQETDQCVQAITLHGQEILVPRAGTLRRPRPPRCIQRLPPVGTPPTASRYSTNDN